MHMPITFTRTKPARFRCESVIFDFETEDLCHNVITASGGGGGNAVGIESAEMGHFVRCSACSNIL